MAYGSEVHVGYVDYDLILQHIPTGIQWFVQVGGSMPDGTTIPDEIRDAVFQEFITKLNQLPDASVLSANKRGTYTAVVTP